MMADGRVLYHNALEGTEDVDISIVAEYGAAAINDQSRVLDFRDGTPSWISPQNVDGGAQPDPEGEETILPPGVGNDSDTFDYNDGALFCSDITMLPDGRLMSVGGTNYYTEPGVSPSDNDAPIGEGSFGVVELEGLNEARIFDPETNDWTQTGSMAKGRWYPTLVTLPDGDVFTASGVTKLLKPVYGTHPLDSGTNVLETEIYDLETGEWSLNPETAERDLPLYPRMSLLPNGDIYYGAGGQVFNPFGQSYGEALWNIAATYDRESQSWTDLGIPGSDIVGEEAAVSGFRGSTFSSMLPLRPNEDGVYDVAEFLIAGGIVGPSPGTYFPVPFARIDTVTMDGDEEALSSATSPTSRPGRTPAAAGTRRACCSRTTP